MYGYFRYFLLGRNSLSMLSQVEEVAQRRLRTVTFHICGRIRQSIFAEHRLLFALRLAVELARADGKISPVQYSQAQQPTPFRYY